MAASDTSIKSYREIKAEGLLGRMQEVVMDAFITHPFTCDREIAEDTNLKINQVTGRRNELVEIGLLGDAGTIEDEVTGRSVHIWAPTEQEIRMPIRQKEVQRKLRRFMR